ncbi:MAG TPA: DUF3187 family protein, partial [Nitrospira sp.]|nr:DUF3187 family protein [Nitrospira sp.]
SGVYLRYGVTEKWEADVEIPVFYRYSGFMGGMITAVERATTGVSPARKALHDTNYVFNVTRGDRVVAAGANGAVGLGDTSLFTKYQVLQETKLQPALSFRAVLKIPTGDEQQFFGSGSPDFGFGLAAEKTVAGRWIFYTNLNGVFPTGHVAGMPLQPTLSGLVAAEYLWSENLSFTAQFEYYSSPFHGTGTRVLDKGVTETTAGFSYRVTRHWLWQVYGVENVDFITGSAADFTLSTVFTYRFNP